ncbi:DUF6166 domain-containing protein [Paracoccus sp. DMF-8]|uniref:DUF6166 domain-containing protein n=1 Tax=Paracoccus sp. DMF-8 TaxID=3019445 RepID=UPI0023E8D78B|nr:DUF6166 domain-containing protein [Paracoccus sp. DMF-8]MDF3604913.1 DUF6166 domain-containing protein [Paracoccus sp. DMF-8]
MKTYIGDRTIDGVVVEVNGQDLPSHTDIKQFTNAAYEWGYEGLAATQLAFAMLYDHSGDASLSIRLAKPFMQEVTANFGNEWEMTGADMDAAIARIDSVLAG